MYAWFDPRCFNKTIKYIWHNSTYRSVIIFFTLKRINKHEKNQYRCQLVQVGVSLFSWCRVRLKCRVAFTSPTQLKWPNTLKSHSTLTFSSPNFTQISSFSDWKSDLFTPKRETDNSQRSSENFTGFGFTLIP